MDIIVVFCETTRKIQFIHDSEKKPNDVFQSRKNQSSRNLVQIRKPFPPIFTHIFIGFNQVLYAGAPPKIHFPAKMVISTNFATQRSKGKCSTK